MRQAIDKVRLMAVYERVASRYDFQHSLVTARSDQRGRALIVAGAVSEGNAVLDCGAGTGSTALLAAEKVGPAGRVTLFDASDAMLAVAKERAQRAGLMSRMEFGAGDMITLPFADETFDAVLSTYSLCPVYDPIGGARELWRVTRPGGRIGVAHSSNPDNRLVKWLAEKVENAVWRFPSISLGCRPVSVLPALEQAGCRVLFSRKIGIPLWPFLVFVVEKPAT